MTTQLSIFDELDAPAPAPMNTCSHCLHTWPVRDFLNGRDMAIHTDRLGLHNPPIPARCVNQWHALTNLYMRAHATHDEHTAERSRNDAGVQWGGNELLWAILTAYRTSCTHAEVRDVLHLAGGGA